jgi:hypothetical protein
MKKNDNEYKKTQSRKWKLVLLVVSLVTVGAFIPPMVSMWIFGALKPLVIVSGTEFVSILTLVVSAYFGANVWQKHVEQKSSLNLSADVTNSKVNQEQM